MDHELEEKMSVERPQGGIDIEFLDVSYFVSAWTPEKIFRQGKLKYNYIMFII